MGTPDDHDQRDFDFLYGDWLVQHRKLKGRLTGSHDWEEFSSQTRAFPMLGGLANLDETRLPDGSWVGMSIRLFQPETGKWQIYWVSPRDGVLQAPVQGSFEGGLGSFFGHEENQGRQVLCRYLWSEIHGPSPRWEQALSADDGQTWETNWTMTHRRA